MGGFLFWLTVVLCVIALVLLFFPFRFRIEFEAGERGCRALFFFFGKKLWTGEKKWGKNTRESGEGAGEARADYLDGDSSDKDVDDAASEIQSKANANLLEDSEGYEKTVMYGGYGGGRWVGFVQCTDRASCIAEAEYNALSGAV